MNNQHITQNTIQWNKLNVEGILLLLFDSSVFVEICWFVVVVVVCFCCCCCCCFCCWFHCLLGVGGAGVGGCGGAGVGRSTDDPCFSVVKSLTDVVMADNVSF